MCSKWSAHYQWLWNLGTDAALAATVFVPCRKMLPGSDFNVIQHLIDIYSDMDEVIMRREAVAKHASALQYRLPEKEEVLRMKGIAPPPDAYDVIIDRLFDSNRGLMEDLVNNPRNRGDHAEHEYYELYPMGKIHQNWTLENFMDCCYGRRKQPYFVPESILSDRLTL